MSTMHVDLDRYLAISEESDPERYFHYDLFVSHRRQDNPQNQITALSDKGIRVSWDHMMDLRDRRITQAVHVALTKSRFIGLYISSGYEDSLWCKAEYLNGLKAQEHYGLLRVVLLLENETAKNTIPEHLKQQPCYLMSDAGITDFIQFVFAENNRASSPALQATLDRATKNFLGLDTSLLDPNEQLNIIKQRLEFWIEGGVMSNTSEMHNRAVNLSFVMGRGITELEILLREIYPIVLDRVTDERNPGIGACELSYIVQIAKLIEKNYEASKRSQEIRITEEWFMDFLFKPLLCSVQEPSLTEEAINVYEKICNHMQKGDYSKEIGIYRETLEAIKRGENLHQALNDQRLKMF